MIYFDYFNCFYSFDISFNCTGVNKLKISKYIKNDLKLETTTINNTV